MEEFTDWARLLLIFFYILSFINILAGQVLLINNTSLTEWISNADYLFMGLISILLDLQQYFIIYCELENYFIPLTCCDHLREEEPNSSCLHLVQKDISVADLLLLYHLMDLLDSCCSDLYPLHTHDLVLQWVHQDREEELLDQEVLPLLADIAEILKFILAILFVIL